MVEPRQASEIVSPPTLLGAESRGGDIASAGFAFQQAVSLALLPHWLANEGFSQFISEAMGDIEVEYFVPGRGRLLELYEVKGLTLQPSKFWEEVKRFRDLAEGYPGVYRRFVIVAPSLSQELSSILNSLKRIKSPTPFYDHSASVNQASYSEWSKIVVGKGRSEEEAAFVFGHVEVDTTLAGAVNSGEALFRQAVIQCFPRYDALANRLIGEIYRDLVELVGSRRNVPITRKELELPLLLKLAEELVAPVRLHTCIETPPEGNERDIRFNWAELFGGPGRAYPDFEVWNKRIVGELRQARQWIQDQRLTRRIHLLGNRRLSTALAIGSNFSAVAGFTIDMEYRGEVWSTTNYPNGETYSFECDFRTGTGTRLVVSVGVIRPIAAEVERSLDQLGLTDEPTLHLHGSMPIVSPRHANVAVAEIKRLIAKTLLSTGAEMIDLFFAGPSHLAVLLGHRLNATAPVQCYEWNSTGAYVKTCLLLGSSTGDR